MPLDFGTALGLERTGTGVVSSLAFGGDKESGRLTTGSLQLLTAGSAAGLLPLLAGLFRSDKRQTLQRRQRVAIGTLQRFGLANISQAARPGLALNLANVAPVAERRQIIETVLGAPVAPGPAFSPNVSPLLTERRTAAARRVAARADEVQAIRQALRGNIGNRGAQVAAIRAARARFLEEVR